MQRTVIVLGMHRSGTSCLAGILEEAGVYFGEVSGSNRYNLKGNRENKRIMKLHDDLFEYNHGTWDNPPGVVKWPDRLKTERDAILQEYNHVSVWGFKDPRTLFTLKGWCEAMQNQRVSLLATFRHPRFVIQSLSNRNHFPTHKSLALWKTYNERLLLYYKNLNFPVISFDLPEALYKAKVKKLLKLLDIESDNKAIRFYDSELRHDDRAPEIDIPQDVARIYEELNRIAI